MKGLPVWGVAVLASKIYLLRHKEHDQVEVYDSITYRLQHFLFVSNARGFTDITSCEYFHCVYIGDDICECIYRVDELGTVTRWNVNEKPEGLSVNAAHSVIITCRIACKIKEFSSHGDLLREIILPDDIINPWHAIQTRTGQFIVCHGSPGDAVHRVCMLSADGKHIVHSHGGQHGSDTGQYNWPRHLAVDDNERVFVADFLNHRVTLLSPTLEYARQVVSRDQLTWRPGRLCLDRQRHLFIAVRERHGDQTTYTAGRVVVLNI